jgi:hypothetical protein
MVCWFFCSGKTIRVISGGELFEGLQGDIQWGI